MVNFYKRMLKLSFRGNTPRITDMDKALTDPYAPKGQNNEEGWFNLNRPGDQSSTGYGADYYTDEKQPPKGISQYEERAAQPPFTKDFDASDPELNDKYPLMDSGMALYDTDSPLGISETVKRKTGIDRDNTSTGPHNQSSKLTDVFDNIRHRLN
jgi:hypothetical protein